LATPTIRLGRTGVLRRNKADGERINAVAGVFFRKALALKDMPKVALAVGTDDFNAAHAKVVVFVAQYGTGNFVVERGPPATAVKLVFRLIEGSVAAAADKSPRCFVVPIFAGKGALRSFFCDHMVFFWRQGIPIFG
jgi:hypothetical protein